MTKLRIFFIVLWGWVMGEKATLRTDLKKIEAVVFDFDGVFTDNRVLVFDEGAEAVICNRSDGFGISSLRRMRIEMLILSIEINQVVTKRAEKLGLPVIKSVKDKLPTLLARAKEKGILVEHIAYLGNDINDRDCLECVGTPVIVADAMPEVKPLAQIILQKSGGNGTVREFCDMLWQAYQKGK